MSREVVIINGRTDREKVARWAHQTGIGTVVEFRKKTRSVEQNAKMHAMLSEVADQVIWCGQKLKVEDWKNMFTASLRKAGFVPGIDPGTVVPLGIHTSTMTVDEMSDMIEAIYAFGADPAHPVIFKDPRENDNTNTGASSTPADDEPTSSPVQSSEPAGASPPPTPAGSQISNEDMTLLCEFARKALDFATEDKMEALREDDIKRMVPGYLDLLKSVEAQDALRQLEHPIGRVLSGKRTREEAEAYIARQLGCNVQDLRIRK